MKRIALWTACFSLMGCGDDGGGGTGTTTSPTTTGNTSTSTGDDSTGETSPDPSTSTTDDPSATVSSTAPPLTTGTGTTGEPGGGQVVFINFDGGDFTSGQDDARVDQSSILMQDETIAAYDGSARAEILSTIQADFAPFDATVTDQRPASGDYTMLVVTPTNFLQFSTLGVAPLDCDDAMSNQVAWLFTDMETNGTLLGSVGSGRLGTTFGTENSEEQADLSWSQLWGMGEDPSWTDQCIEVMNQMCGDQHAPHCPAGQQNTFAALTDVFGAAP